MIGIGLDTIIYFVPPLLLLEGFFSGSEIALLSADKLTLKASVKRGSARAKVALELASHPERVLSATLLMTSLCVIGISSLITLFLISHGSEHVEIMAIAITSPIVVIFGELLPKTFYQRYSERLTPWVATPVNFVYWAFYPITRVLSGYTNRLSRLLGPIEELVTGKRHTTREELVSMLSYGKQDSEIKSSEKRMIKRILDFKDSEAKHALIPLVKIDAIEDDTNVRQALEKFKRHRHSRMPVFSNRIDNIIGVLELSELASITDLELPIRKLIAPAHYVAETQGLRELLADMRRDNLQMTVVVDEYGGAIGILTFEDVIEEIVGEINDEFDPETKPYRDFGEDAWLVQGRMEIQAINESLRLDLPEGDYETLAGFMLQQFNRIPEPSDELYFDTTSGSFKFTVRKASERQIESVFIEKLKRAGD